MAVESTAILRERLRLCRGDDSIAEFAKKIEVTAGYVSGAESGKKPVSEKLLKRYMSFSGHPREYFLPSEVLLDLSDKKFPDELVDALQSTPSEDRPAKLIAMRTKSKWTEEIYDDCVDIEQTLTALDLLFAHEASRQTPKITIFWSARHYGPGLALYDHVTNILIPQFLAAGGEIVHIFRNADDRQAEERRQVFETVLMVAKLVKRYAAYQGKYNARLLPHVNIRRMPADLYYAEHGGFFAGMAHQLTIAPTCGFMVRKGLKSMRQYVQMLLAYADAPVEVFSHERFLQFLTEYAKSESIRDHRCMVQRHFANVTRPTTDFNEESEWFKRLVKRYNLHEATELMTQRKLAANDFMRKASDFDVRQIASEDELLNWARTGLHGPAGQYTNIDAKLYSETKKEMVARIQNIRTMIENFPRFKLAIIPAAQFDRLTGVGIISRPYEVSWVSQGKAAVIIEVADTSQMYEGNAFQVIIKSGRDAIAEDFATQFDVAWKSLKESIRDQRHTVGVLDSLINAISI